MRARAGRRSSLGWVATIAIGLVGVAVIVLLESREAGLRQPGTGVAAVGEHEPVRRPIAAASTPHAQDRPVSPGRRDISVPILMYHVIGDPPLAVGYSELYVTASDFGRQLDWLEEHGFEAVTLGDVWNHWQGLDRLPRRPIVISFDDGTRSTPLRALPALAAKGWPGVLNLDVSNLEPSWGIRPLQVQALIDAGWELDSHSLTHPDLTHLDRESLEREVGSSRTAIRRLFAVTAEFFCYPSGRFDDRVAAAVEAAGYLGATTTIYGLAARRDPYRLARVRIDRSDGLAGFVRKLEELARPRA